MRDSETRFTEHIKRALDTDEKYMQQFAENHHCMRGGSQQSDARPLACHIRDGLAFALAFVRS